MLPTAFCPCSFAASDFLTDNPVLSPKPRDMKLRLVSQNVEGISIFTAGLVLVCLANDIFLSSGEEADINSSRA